jgi:uncharacterized membrane protein YeaQ/YmgE (transglycosylase-associated protein family)
MHFIWFLIVGAIVGALGRLLIRVETRSGG